MQASDADPSKPPPLADQTPRAFQSEELFGSQKVIIICHKGQTYRLLVTRNDKLILHK